MFYIQETEICLWRIHEQWNHRPKVNSRGYGNENEVYENKWQKFVFFPNEYMHVSQVKSLFKKEMGHWRNQRKKKLSTDSSDNVTIEECTDDVSADVNALQELEAEMVEFF